jgi:[acyl-carrier-protein] S-malonyltransferase
MSACANRARRHASGVAAAIDLVMIAFLFPGQGSQKVGMGRELADAFDVARQTFAEADAAFARSGGPEGAPLRAADGPEGQPLPAHVEADLQVRLRLSDICFNGPDAQIMLTENTQPAILAVSIAAYRVLAAHGLEPHVVAGHSLGEYSAHVAAGTFDFADAIEIVRRRGRYMQEAVPVGTGAMAAILGADLELVQQACDEAAAGEVVSPANINGPGQIVIAGAAAAVERASARARELGARRAVPLPVSAPFHCALMKPAEARLEPALRALAVRQPRVPVVANVDAEPRRDAASSIDALVHQMSAPVLWEQVVRRLASDGVTTYVEVGPGTVLGGLVKKIHAGASILHFGSPEELDTVLAACSISAER